MAHMRLAHRFVLCLLLLTPWHAALAMRFAYHPPATMGGGGLLSASGEVRLGDEERLRDALRAVPKGARLAGISLDSPGGDLEEGLRLATAVHDARLPTVVDDGAKCASACFIVFAAGSHLFASTTALVGVHSVAFRGRDNPDAQAATVRMARRLAEYGVPDAILGKMVSAQPSQIWWLNRSDLESMRVDSNVPHAQAVATAVDSPDPAAAPAPAQTVTSGFRIEAGGTRLPNRPKRGRLSGVAAGLDRIGVCRPHCRAHRAAA